jgi:4-amino-4-deoxy-L-arabinose transferase-like glycosyltransferase
LDSLPFGTWYDEAEIGLQALRIMQNPDHRPIFVGSVAAPSHYVYLTVAAFEYFGVSTHSIRLVSVMMGLATVLAGYLAGYELFGRGGGLMLAFLLAVSRWNINLTRIGMFNAATPLFALLAIAFLLRGLRQGRYRDFALAGLSLGLGLCFYVASQLFVIVVCIFLLVLMVKERNFLRRFWVGLVLMFSLALLVITPVLLFASEKPDIYFARTKETSIFANKTPEQWLPALLENAREHLLMFNHQGDRNGRHNWPDKPMLDPYSGALMVLGLGLCLWRGVLFARQSYALLLPIWLVTTLLGGIISLDFESPQSLRAIGTLPVVYILAVIPLQALWQAWRHGGGRYFPNTIALPIGVLFALLGNHNFDSYFFRQAYDAA